MKKKNMLYIVLSLLPVFLAAAFISCSSGGSDGVGGGNNPTTGKIVGKLSSNATGAGIANAAVSGGGASTTTASDGSYTLNNLAASSRVVLAITASGYASTSKITKVIAGGTSRVDASLLPVAASPTLSSLVSSATLTVPGSTAQVDLTANSLVTASGAAPSFPITANITPIDPSSNPQLMPGDFTASAGDQIESFGAIVISFTDSTGAPLNLASGSSAAIRIPVAASVTSPPSTMDLYYYNTTTGLWVNEGTLTLGGTAPDQYYAGTVTHFSTWNADMVYTRTCITGRVVNSSGSPVTSARVEAQGMDYIGTTLAYTASNGTFNVPVKSNSDVMVTASTSRSQSNSEVVSTGAVGSVCTALPDDLTLGAVYGGSGAGSAKIKLTWGTDPSDLDSHLTGPDAAGSLTRFHVYYMNRGSLTSAPFAELDVDDVTSFGPEVITISKFVAGTYRYSVHHYSGSGTIYTSPARVELLLNGSTTVFTPPSPGATVIGYDTVWQVFELAVSAGGTVTVNPLNTYVLNVSASSVTAPSWSGIAIKPAMADWNW